MAPAPSRRDVSSRSGYHPSRGASSNNHKRRLDVERASCPSCNLCHKKFSTCAFICACDCIFCEGTVQHSKMGVSGKKDTAVFLWSVRWRTGGLAYFSCLPSLLLDLLPACMFFAVFEPVFHPSLSPFYCVDRMYLRAFQ